MSRLFSPVRAQHQFLQNYLKFQIALFQLKGHGNFFKEHQRSECLSSFFGAPGAYRKLPFIMENRTCATCKRVFSRKSDLTYLSPEVCRG